MNRIATLTLSTPPSANETYAPIGRGRMPRTAKYNQWIGAWINAGLMNLLRLPQHTPAWVRIEARLTRQRDLDNCVKPTLDLLRRIAVISDDRFIDRITATRSDELQPGTLRVSWGAIDNQPEQAT